MNLNLSTKQVRILLECIDKGVHKLNRNVRNRTRANELKEIGKILEETYDGQNKGIIIAST